MVWVFVGVAIIVLALAAWAGTGRLGEMPEVVTDRPKGRVPDGPIDAAFLDEARLPTASSGYDRRQVDDFLARVAGGEPLQPVDAEFDVVSRGYDMQVVDELLDRLPPLGRDLADDDFERPAEPVVGAEHAVDDEAEAEAAEADVDPADPDTWPETAPVTTPSQRVADEA